MYIWAEVAKVKKLLLLPSAESKKWILVEEESRNSKLLIIRDPTKVTSYLRQVTNG